MNENLMLAQDCIDNAQELLSLGEKHLTAYDVACLRADIDRAQKYLEAYYKEQQK